MWRDDGGLIMSSDLTGAKNQTDLRLSALRRLTGEPGSHETRLNASAALGALFELASSPSTAGAALALLHELQVYQVELELQDEELRRSRIELEATLIRQTQLYDFAPVGLFTVDRNTALRELNLAAASMLGSVRDQLLGRTLDSFLVPASAHTLHTILTGLSGGAPAQVGALKLVSGRSVHICVNRDPDGRNFLIAVVNATGHEGSSIA
jgi:PAS domain-containing protein